MKKVLMTIILMCLLVAGCDETCRPTASILTGSDIGPPDTPIIGRLGVDSDGVGFGLEVNLLGGNVERESYGAYITTELEPTPLGTPYVGYHALLAIDNAGEEYGPILGTLLDVGGITTVIEGQYVSQANENDQYRAFAGVRVKF